MTLCYMYEEEGVCMENCPGYNNAQVCMNSRSQKERDKRVNHSEEFFKSVGMNVKYHPHGLLLDNNYVFSPKSYKWKNHKKNKWYRSAGPESFYKKFVVK